MLSPGPQDQWGESCPVLSMHVSTAIPSTEEETEAHRNPPVQGGMGRPRTETRVSGAHRADSVGGEKRVIPFFWASSLVFSGPTCPVAGIQDRGALEGKPRFLSVPSCPRRPKAFLRQPAISLCERQS